MPKSSANQNSFIPLARPDLSDRETQYVLEVLRSGRLALGEFSRRFEEAVASYTGCPAVAVSSGTAGLHLALLAAGVKAGDWVITTPFSFIASSNAILYTGADPLFLDIEISTLNLDVENVGAFLDTYAKRTPQGVIHRPTGRRIAALLPVEVFGHLLDYHRWVSLARRWGLPLVVDSCEAMGSFYIQGNERFHAGTLADFAVFAFYPNKQMTTGEGGVVITQREDALPLLQALRNQGRMQGGHWLRHDIVGYNYRMDELSAAVGLAQIERIEELRRRRKEVAKRYHQLLSEYPTIRVPEEAPFADVNWFVYVIRVSRQQRNHVLERLIHAGVEVRPYFDPPIHLQPPYRERYPDLVGRFPIAERVSQEVIALPFYNHLTEVEQKRIVDVLIEALT